MLQEKHKLSYLTFLILARFQDPQISEQRSLSLIFYALALFTFPLFTFIPYPLILFSRPVKTGQPVFS